MAHDRIRSLDARRLAAPAALLAAALAAVVPDSAAASDPARTPLLVGPVAVDAAAASFPAASYHVTFGEGASRADVELVLQVQSATEVVLGFAGRRVDSLTVTIDGAPAPIDYSIAPLPVAGGPFDSQILVHVPPSPTGVRAVVLHARCETDLREIDAGLTYPEASILANLWLDGPRARVLRLDPASAVAAPLTVHLETLAPHRPEGPLAASAAATTAGAVLDGPVAPGTAAPFEISAVEGEVPVARTWGFALGIGLALDWPHVENRVYDGTPPVMIERWYSTKGFSEPTARMWLSGTFRFAFRDQWMFGVGVEGDPLGVLEIPLLFTWHPKAPPADQAGRILDYHVLFGLGLQLLNDMSPGEYGFDPRPFVRVGAGLRFHVLTFDLAYEIAPPVGDWNGPNGLLEHKLLFTFPFTL